MNKCIAAISRLSSLWRTKRHPSQFSLLLIMLMLSLPGYSHAWSLSTRVLTTGGAIQVDSGALLTSVNGTVLKSYTTSRNVPVALLPNTGYQISGVTVNGTPLASPYPSTVSMGLTAYPGKTSQSLSVGFSKILVPIISTVETPGGSVSPSGTYNLQYTSTASYTFSPNTGSSLWKIVGLPADATLTSYSTGAPVTLPYAGIVRATFTVPRTSLTLSGAFVPVLANAGAPKTMLPGATVIIQGSAKTYDGSSLADVSYAWTVKSGPTGGKFGSPNAPVSSFTANTVGNYTLQLQATDSLGATSVVTTNITVTDSFAAAGRGQCQGCHQLAGFTATTFNSWSTSKHRADGVMCAYCHVGSDTGAHPTLHGNSVDKNTYLYNLNMYPPTPGSFCLNGSCHNPGANHKTDGMLCSTCHTGGTHNTDATYAASLNTCSTCHAPSSACFTNYATDQCITCHTTVHGPKLLHHFAFANITTQQAGIPFNITVTAKDYSNNTVAGFTGMADITVTGGSSPAIPTANFVAGVWSGEVTVSQPGTGKTLTATRSGGNETGISNPFTVLPAPGNYIFEWLEPVSLEKPFQQGETVPVKFKLTDSNGAIVSTASACLEVYPVSEDTMAGDPVVIESHADPGTCFRFSEDHYIYNLDTGNLAPGTYHLHAVFTDGRVEMIKMTLKAKNKKQ